MLNAITKQIHVRREIGDNIEEILMPGNKDYKLVMDVRMQGAHGYNGKIYESEERVKTMLFYSLISSLRKPLVLDEQEDCVIKGSWAFPMYSVLSSKLNYESTSTNITRFIDSLFMNVRSLGEELNIDIRANADIAYEVEKKDFIINLKLADEAIYHKVSSVILKYKTRMYNSEEDGSYIEKLNDSLRKMLASSSISYVINKDDVEFLYVPEFSMKIKTRDDLCAEIEGLCNYLAKKLKYINEDFEVSLNIAGFLD